MPENITKLKDTTLAKCCKTHEVTSTNICCFAPDIYSELRKLMCRHKYTFTKRKRLLELAEPKTKIERFLPKCACRFGKNVEIVKLEKPVYTRTEQLAYPPLRKLLLFKEAYKHLFPAERLEVLNRLARYSLFSIYSRLQNIRPPEKKIPIKKWDAAEWKAHTKYLKKLAKHKQAPKVPRMFNPTMPFKKMKRYKKLAHHKVHIVDEKTNWILTPEVKYYNPTPRILVLSRPVLHPMELKLDPFIPNRQAMKAKPSKRVKELAMPLERYLKKSATKDDAILPISANALRYKASQRILDLAEPKEDPQEEKDKPRYPPFKISEAALKAKAKERTIELAKPKVVTPKHPMFSKK